MKNPWDNGRLKNPTAGNVSAFLRAYGWEFFDYVAKNGKKRMIVKPDSIVIFDKPCCKEFNLNEITLYGKTDTNRAFIEYTGGFCWVE